MNTNPSGANDWFSFFEFFAAGFFTFIGSLTVTVHCFSASTGFLLAWDLVTLPIGLLVAFSSLSFVSKAASLFDRATPGTRNGTFFFALAFWSDCARCSRHTFNLANLSCNFCSWVASVTTVESVGAFVAFTFRRFWSISVRPRLASFLACLLYRNNNQCCWFKNNNSLHRLTSPFYDFHVVHPFVWLWLSLCWPFSDQTFYMPHFDSWLKSQVNY